MPIEHTTDIYPASIASAAAAFMRSVNARQASPNTINIYTLHVDALSKHLAALGITDMTAVTYAHIEAFFGHLATDHNRGGVHCYYRSVRAWFNWHWSTYDIEQRNPIAKVKVPAPIHKALPGIPMNHFRLLVDACKTGLGMRDKAILYCLLDSCARATEFVSLNIGDVDFITGHALIRKGKGSKSRTVRFGDRSMRALRAYLKQKRGLKIPERQPLFTTDDFERMDRFTLRMMLDRRADDAKIPHYGLHDLRRRGALELYNNGMSIKDISVYLGHSSVKVTELYLNVTNDDVLEKHQASSPVDNL
jgi:integrase/recombinase XerD